MTALFADTFYWIALADFTDSADQRALTLTTERAASRIITTDEVLPEYLTFFSTAPEPLRRGSRRQSSLLVQYERGAPYCQESTWPRVPEADS